MENKTVRKKYRTFYAYEYRYLECWLNDMAKDGWVLSERRGNFKFWFERSPDSCRRYRCMPKSKSAALDEEVALYDSAGWTYMDSQNGISIYYTDFPDAPELFTDEDSYERYSRRTRKTILACVLLTLGLALPLWGRNLWSSLHDDYFYHELASGTYFFLLFPLFVCVWVLLVGVIRPLRELRRIKAGDQSTKNLNYKRLTRINAIVWILLLIFTAVPLIELVKINLISDGKIVPVAQLDDKAEALLVEAFANPDDTCGFRQTQSFFYPEQYDVRVGAYEYDDGEIADGLWDYGEKGQLEYVVARTEGLADKWMREDVAINYIVNRPFSDELVLIIEQLEKSENLDVKQAFFRAIELKREGCAYVGYFKDGEGYQQLFIRKGKKCLTFMYNGPIDLISQIPAFVDKLQ